MGLFVTEYAGPLSGRPLGYSGIMTEPAIKTSVMSSGSSDAATLLTLSSGTSFVTLACDVAFYLLFRSSLGTTGSQSSTSVAPVVRAVRPSIAAVMLTLGAVLGGVAIGICRAAAR